MKKSSASNPQSTSPLFNLALIIVLILTALPFILFALIQFAPESFGSTTKTVASTDTPKRLSAAERRAAREEARKAEAEAAARPAGTPAPIITTTTVPGPGPGMGPMDFGPGMGPGRSSRAKKRLIKDIPIRIRCGITFTGH